MTTGEAPAIEQPKVEKAKPKQRRQKVKRRKAPTASRLRPLPAPFTTDEFNDWMLRTGWSKPRLAYRTGISERRLARATRLPRIVGSAMLSRERLRNQMGRSTRGFLHF